jgi:hypothetical protein
MLFTLFYYEIIQTSNVQIVPEFIHHMLILEIECLSGNYN